MSLFIVIITIFGVSYNVIVPKAYPIDYDKQITALYQDGMWHLGKNLSIGDSYTYKICDPHHIPGYSAESYHYFTKNLDHNSSLCYVIKLDFVNFLSSDNKDHADGHAWVIHASISNVSDNSVTRSMFHLNPKNYDVRSVDTVRPDAIQYAQSVQNTIFSIFKYAEAPKLLKVGSTWGTVTESLDFDSNPHMKVFDDSAEYSTILNMVGYDGNSVTSTEKIFSNIYKIGYDVDIINTPNDVTTSYIVTSDIPFPLSGIKYSPVHVTKPFKTFEFELLSYTLQKNEKGDIVIKEENHDTITRDFDEIYDDINSLNHHSTKNDDTDELDTNIIDELILNNDNNIIIDESTVRDLVIDEGIVDDVVVSDNDITQNDISDDINHETNIVETISESKNTDEKSDSLLYAIVAIPIIVIGMLAYLKTKKNLLKHVSTNYFLSKKASSNTKSFTKIIDFKDKVTIKINKTNSDFAEESQF